MLPVTPLPLDSHTISGPTSGQFQQSFGKFYYMPYVIKNNNNNNNNNNNFITFQILAFQSVITIFNKMSKTTEQ